MLNSIAMTLLFTASVTSHGPAQPTQVNTIEARMGTQTAKIVRGVRNGSLTRREARILRRKQMRDRRLLRRCLRDRLLSRSEARFMRRTLRRTDRMLRRFQRNGRARFSRKIYHGRRLHRASVLETRVAPQPVAALATGIVGGIILSKWFAHHSH
jgi:hypothetical protein